MRPATGRRRGAYRRARRCWAAPDASHEDTMTTPDRLPRIQKLALVDLPTLDSLLDVPVASWERNLKKVVRELRQKGARLAVPASLRDGGQLESTEIGWTTLFEAQIKSLPRMDRAEEFRMARRYEFAKARVGDALQRAGHRPELVAELTLRPYRALPEPTRRSTAADQQHLRQCIDELERLRNVYVEGALYLVHAPVRRYSGLGVDEVDLIQETAASLFQAIEGFDWRRDVRFKTYAVYWIQQAILKTLYNASRTVRIPIWVQKAYRKIKRAQEEVQHVTGTVADLTIVAGRVDMPIDRVEEILAVRRFAVSLDAAVGGDDGFSLGQTLHDDSADPIPEAIREGDLGSELRAVLADLPDRERTILVRRFGLDGQEPETLAEIAKDFGVTAERVRQLQKAALERLQKPRSMQRLKAFA
ncbi:MAG: sigma-70 family RNA polymerase sigma factor [Planctomycetes bacterium]|nr:sigma-70 family RNA polymerase sigma factor [Planctomycetota bacterium]